MRRLLAVATLFLGLSLTSSPAAGDSKAYVIGPEDVIEVQVWDNKDLNQVGFVRPDGKISLPLAGELQASGKTVKQLEEELVRAYSKTVKGAVVTVLIKDIKSRPVFFIGGFGRPGVLPLTRDYNVVQAVGVMGGVAPGGDAERGFLLRGDKKIPIDFDRLFKRGDLSQNMTVEPGDTFVVPLADLVYIQGEVRTPGAIKYTTDLTVVKAVTQSGGVTPLAAPGRVEILRGEGEKRQRIRVDLDKMLRAPEENPDVRLRADDIIFVPQRLF
jgi:polysaccharide biosynthesis/export protein